MDSSTPIEDRPGIMIGAWGFRFFECDHDYDIVSHLSADCGLWHPDESTRESLLNPKNSTRVIKHLDGGGETTKIFDKYFSMLQKYKVMDIKKEKFDDEMMLDSPRYYIFILGFLAMKLGCIIPRKMRRWMNANVDACMFMYERIDQAKKALREYETGKPLDLGSKTLSEKINDPTPNKQNTGKKLDYVNVPNNNKFLSTMRMHIDNHLAEQHNGTKDKSVDISNLLNENLMKGLVQSLTLPVDLQAIIEQPFHVSRNNGPGKVASFVNGLKSYSWASESSQDARLADHEREGFKSQPLDTSSMAELLRKLWR